MKTFKLIVLLMLGVAGTLHAQSDDEIILDGTDITYSPPQKSLSGEAPRNCSSIFFEGVVFWGGSHFSEKVDAGFGISMAYVPRHWGAYGTLSFPDYGLMGSCGAVLRPFANPSFLDWQLFAGPAFYKGAGFEAGMRFSGTRQSNHGDFAWMSASFSYIYLPDWTFFNVGVSLDFIYLLGLFFW